MTNSQPAKSFMNTHYASQVKARCNTCSVATWVINREHHLYETRDERGFFLKTIIKRLCAKKPEDSASQSLTETAPCESKAVCTDCKILIVCKGSTFSQNVMDYSINLATKTRSNLVALNLDERGSGFKGFREESVNNVTNFCSMATEAGLQFEHIVEQGAESSVVAKLYDSDPAFRYVLDDVDGTMSKKQIIPVYTRATMRTR